MCYFRFCTTRASNSGMGKCFSNVKLQRCLQQGCGSVNDVEEPQLRALAPFTTTTFPSSSSIAAGGCHRGVIGPHRRHRGCSHRKRGRSSAAGRRSFLVLQVTERRIIHGRRSDVRPVDNSGRDGCSGRSSFHFLIYAYRGQLSALHPTSFAARRTRPFCGSPFRQK